MGKFVALLRGVNVGGHNKVPMPALKKAFEGLGLENVKTLLASGNVVFEGDRTLVGKIPGALEKTFGFAISTIILPFEAITEIVRSDPFKSVRVTPKTRLYVTFLGAHPAGKPKLPIRSDDGSFTIIGLTDSAVYSFLDLGKSGTPEAMSLLEKTFGKNVTTRNFNTVVKLAGL